MKIFLDDKRNPPDNSWKVVRSYNDFVKLVETTPHIITQIAFDHDLGLESDGKTEAKNGYDAAKFFVNYVMDHDPKMGEMLEAVYSQSDNPGGRENILAYFRSAKKHGKVNPDLIIES